jgi:hypothetical protein
MIPLFAALLLQTAPAPAAPVCTATTPPPAGFEAWNVVSGNTADAIPLAKTTSLTLTPSADVKFAFQPERAPAAGTFSGVYHLTVQTAGTYRVALSAGAWIDLAQNGVVLKSVAHTEGPACSGIRKIVDFTLAPGTYALQLSGAKAAEIHVLIAPK